MINLGVVSPMPVQQPWGPVSKQVNLCKHSSMRIVGLEIHVWTVQVLLLVSTISSTRVLGANFLTCIYGEPSPRHVIGAPYFASQVGH